jgi:hypothetical protein
MPTAFDWENGSVTVLATRFRIRDVTSIGCGVFASPWESRQNGSVAVVSPML